MKLCYNKVMKIIFKILVISFLLISPVFANDVKLLVLPADLLNTKENYYNFDEVSVIIANDIINDFNNSKGKIQSPDLYQITSKINYDSNIKNNLSSALKKYKTTGKIDYSTFKDTANFYNTKYILLISSSAVTNKNSIKRSVWDVLELVTECDIIYPYRLETSLVLLDTTDNSIIWSNNYSSKLGANDNKFAAKNFAQANAEYEKIKLYSNSIVASSASQNIILRFYPKSVSPIETKVKDSGGALRYDKRLPEMPKLREHNNSQGNTNDLLFEF